MLLKKIAMVSLLSLVCCLGGCAEEKKNSNTPPPEQDLSLHSSLVTDASVKDIFYVNLETSKGDIIIEVHPEWAPIGATQFHKLVEAKFYDGCRFFRVIDSFVAQTGINGDPEVNVLWRDKNLKTEEVKQGNTLGMVTFAQQGNNPNTRTTQFFINYHDDNVKLDKMFFPPFGKVVEGMDHAKSFFSGYDSESIKRGAIFKHGNRYLEENFPNLDYIKTARIIQYEMKNQK